MLKQMQVGMKALERTMEEAHSDILSGELNGVLALAILDDFNIDVLTLRRNLCKLIYEIEEIIGIELGEESSALVDETLQWIDSILDKLDEMQQDLDEIEGQSAEQEEEYEDDYSDTLDCGCCSCCGCSCDYDDGYGDDCYEDCDGDCDNCEDGADINIVIVDFGHDK